MWFLWTIWSSAWNLIIFPPAKRFTHSNRCASGMLRPPCLEYPSAYGVQHTSNLSTDSWSLCASSTARSIIEVCIDDWTSFLSARGVKMRSICVRDFVSSFMRSARWESKSGRLASAIRVSLRQDRIVAVSLSRSKHCTGKLLYKS